MGRAAEDMDTERGRELHLFSHHLPGNLLGGLIRELQEILVIFAGTG